MQNTISVVDVSKRYAADQGVFDLTFDVPAGHIFGLIGPSGSGKTTAVRLLAGLLSRDHGTMEVLGTDPDQFGEDIRSRLGYLPQSTLLYPTLTMRENLEFVGSLYGFIRKERRSAAHRMLEMVDLADHAKMRLSEASGGMRRRLGLAAALLHEPEVIFLDEPTAGLDPILRRSLWERFRQMSDEGRTLIVTTQYVGEAAYCDTITLLTEGRIIAAGLPEELRSAAFGGEFVDVVFTETPSWAVLSHIGEATEAVDVRTTGPRSARLVVPDAGTAIPLISALAGDLEIGIAEAERHLPEFDDVFVRLVDARTAEVT